MTVAIPVAMGDTTEKGGFPIVGTIPEFFDMDYAPNKPFLVKGHGFQRDFDAYIGDRVARDNGWGIGTKLKLVHGGAEVGHVHHEEFEVVGLLAPTGTPHDKTVYVNLKGFYQIQGHDKPLKEAIERERKFFGEPALAPEELKNEVVRIRTKGQADGIPDIQKEVTAILLQCKSPIAANLMSGELKKGNQAQAVNPIVPMQKLLKEFLGPVESVLLAMTSLIILVSGISIFVSIYNSMSARRREIAIMRALGAQRGTVLSIILAESIILCVGGGLLGLVLGHGLVFAAAPVVAAWTGLIVDPIAFSPYESILFPVLFALGALIGFLPGMTAYRTDVAESLNG